MDSLLYVSNEVEDCRESDLKLRELGDVRKGVSGGELFIMAAVDLLYMLERAEAGD